ncbi:MAG: nucleotide exchange factor GrpE [candidate division Zixibacteria bacterium RBG_16_50_21]|nr:MAG: nucleotide exchange factor GrpE [candidate division Zixibacteria bacterium RBG_16_50_21]
MERDKEKKEKGQSEDPVQQTESQTSQQPVSEMGQLGQKLSETETRNKELEERLLRLAAEFDNYKKRTIREFENIIKNANQNLILDLVDILNNFSRALESPHNNQDLKAFKEGIELIYIQMKSLLNKEGLEEIKAKGEKFDPALHDAIMQLESDQQEGTVLEEIGKGYKLNDKVIRHSQVVVAKKKEETSEEENNLSQEGKGE